MAAATNAQGQTRPTPGAFLRAADVPQLSTSFVLFLDLLGTTEAAKDVNAQTTLVALDAALARARARSSLDEDWSWSDSSWFSDNLVVAANLETAGAHIEAVVGGVIVSAAWLQFLLAIEGFFARGGIVAGGHFMDHNITFGPALVGAVALEKLTKQPRIALADTAVGLVHAVSRPWGPHSTSNPFQQELAVDSDDTVFIDYLRTVVGEADDDDEARLMVTRHRRAVEQQLAASHEPGIASKYEWSARYHDFVCDDLGLGKMKFDTATPPTMTRFVAYPPTD